MPALPTSRSVLAHTYEATTPIAIWTTPPPAFLTDIATFGDCTFSLDDALQLRVRVRVRVHVRVRDNVDNVPTQQIPQQTYISFSYKRAFTFYVCVCEC